jgi:hypothetical protein
MPLAPADAAKTKGRVCDEAATVLVDYSHDLIDRTLGGITDHRMELLLAGDNVAKTMTEHRPS